MISRSWFGLRAIASSSFTSYRGRSSSHARNLACRLLTAKPSSNSAGAAVFQEYLKAGEKIQLLKEEEEKKRSEELYRAWKRSSEREHQKNIKSTGVAVVKTIVKQANQNKNDGQTDQDVIQWEKRAAELLQEAAIVHEYPEALVLLANQWLDKATEQTTDAAILEDLNKVLVYYDKACSLGSKEGCFNHGNLLWTGFPSVESKGNQILVPDQKTALSSFQKAIDLGDTDSMYFVGVVLLSDEDDETNTASSATRKERLEMGLKLIEQAGSLGHSGALYYLSIFFLNGNSELGIEPCSAQEFAERLDAAVAAGDSDALFLRGHSFYYGDTPPYPIDYSRALNDFLAAAELGHADAAISAGAILHQPHPGVEQDQRRAFLLYQQAGELGSQEGWRNVVACYLSGEGVPQSLETAKYIAETMLKEA